ncbi:MAG: glycoside-pentoside-hexuronide (GPH):cation symporter [Muribaculaceae bacterium]|nr:glycoside-pentoside-hexuronide (GPH):cation symporter [Roseburia sp.]MCM1432060.1 glycoside-pentoside-hexuronide (GPH):cation symporter [Muribaculaceae bacterium]MCM1494076.1 glycoside-pentoside-hexuronide (GPH):cation symporter [Muribaculaceae bacterium]
MKLRLKEKVSYGLGAVGKDMVYMFSASYILYYYQDILGVSAIAMGLILMAARVFDAFNDPIMGVLVAKTRTKWGKFRPWLLIGTILNAVILVLMFAAPPSLDGKGLVAYAAVTYILWGVTYTMMDIPYWSMIPAFTEGGKEREGLSTLARSCAGVGSALITIITVKCVSLLGQGNERAGFRMFAIIIAVVFIVFILCTCINIREKSTVDVESPSVGQMFRALIENDQAMAVVIAIVLINCSVYTTSNLVIYFFKYDFGGADWENAYTLFNTFGGAIQILSMMLFFPLLRKVFSAIKVFYISFGMAIAGYIALLVLAFVNMSSVFLLFIPGFFIFAANGMLTVLVTVFLANTVDYGELKNNRRDESVIFSMQTFVVKLASGVAALIASICLTLCNLSDDTDAVATASGASVVGLRMTMTVIPIIGLLIAVFVFHRRFILTEEKVEEIAAQVKAKREAKE